MSWCPQCGTEYREGFSECRDCGVSLVPSPPEAKEEFLSPDQVRETLLTIVRDELDFTRVESLMAEAGIPVLKKHHGSGGYLEIYMGATPYGIEVYVPQSAHEKAKALLSGDETVWDGMAQPLQPLLAPENPEGSDAEGPVVLDAHEEKELYHYLDAVNQDMYRKKQAIATMMLVSMGAGVLWTVYSVLKEMF